MKELVAQALQAAEDGVKEPLKINYGKEMETELAAMEQEISSNPGLPDNLSPRWLTVKLLEGDEGVLKWLNKYPSLERLLARRDEIVNQLEGVIGEDIESFVADRRYGFIGGLAREVVTRRKTAEERLSTSDKIDRVITNRYLGSLFFY